jgi:hypothetical protein
MGRRHGDMLLRRSMQLSAGCVSIVSVLSNAQAVAKQSRSAKPFIVKLPNERAKNSKPRRWRGPDGYYVIRPERWEEEVNWRVDSFTGGWLPIEWESGVFESVGLAEKQAFADYRWLAERKIAD